MFCAERGVKNTLRSFAGWVETPWHTGRKPAEGRKKFFCKKLPKYFCIRKFLPTFVAKNETKWFRMKEKCLKKQFYNF
ncbi:hypothetical protein BACPLE_01151 [Phocaeicola plebeius DSM 17135]|uniref:Uncharacterized protein n=1 Tax=Phocaeicola plebeius (strain DSM 17135 / JCM 12973 / CCUG 54634 / M2) TaxID=484018 RepID=B5CWR1_PHOPM|nr:hypothetical protein BACPLE_01151 [Phocaeicola plebeius DSM 17135]